MLDISESGRQIGEKLFALLDASQQQELMQYVLAQKQGGSPDTSLHNISPQIISTIPIVGKPIGIYLRDRDYADSERVRHLRPAHHESPPGTHL